MQLSLTILAFGFLGNGTHTHDERESTNLEIPRTLKDVFELAENCQSISCDSKTAFREFGVQTTDGNVDLDKIIKHCDKQSWNNTMTQIGSGTFGAVFKSRDYTDYVFKLLKAQENAKRCREEYDLQMDLALLQPSGTQINTEDATVKDFEAQASDIPNVITAWKFKPIDVKCNWDGIMVMKYGGVTLNEHMQSFGGEYRNHSLSFMKQISKVLFDLEQNNLVHRDIKSRNIVYDSETNQFSLIDWGQLRNISRPRRISGTFGTTRQVSPDAFFNSNVEARKKFKEANSAIVENYRKFYRKYHSADPAYTIEALRKEDVWAFGILILAMLNPEFSREFNKSKSLGWYKQLPEFSSNLNGKKVDFIEEYFKTHIKHNSVPDYLKPILFKALAKDHKKRGSAAEIYKMIQRIPLL